MLRKLSTRIGLTFVALYLIPAVILVILIPFSMGASFIALANWAEMLSPLGSIGVLITEPWKSDIYLSLNSSGSGYGVLLWIMAGLLLNSLLLYLAGWLVGFAVQIAINKVRRYREKIL